MPLKACNYISAYVQFCDAAGWLTESASSQREICRTNPEADCEN